MYTLETLQLYTCSKTLSKAIGGEEQGGLNPAASTHCLTETS